jgi:hypothetical protein
VSGVRVWIEEAGYEDPYMYWSTGPKPYAFTPEYEIPSEDYERWESVKKAWDDLQEEVYGVMKNSLFRVPAPPRTSPGLPW